MLNISLWHTKPRNVIEIVQMRRKTLVLLNYSDYTTPLLKSNY